MKATVINVRWLDGLLESFEAVTNVRLGGGLLYFELGTATNRHIPLCSVRWFSVVPPTREVFGN